MQENMYMYTILDCPHTHAFYVLNLFKKRFFSKI